MGHYKEIRGWIQFDDSNFGDCIGKAWEYKDHRELVDALKDWITTSESEYRESLKDSFHLHIGHNGVIFLFVGARVKDYFGDIEKFIRDIIKKFPYCNGIVFVNEREHEQRLFEKIWLIKNEKISETRIGSIDNLFDNLNKI